MANVNGVTGAGAPSPVEPTGSIASKGAIHRLGQTADTVEISTAAKLAMKIREVPEVRTELIARVKEEIAAGTYETPERIDAAVERLLADLLPGT
ncbi:MAG: flagellar biosynthesis anti-sigma factor FlgM [Planctomycetaceae bacterium]|nr:flagellar biosynthesis anti-sigma factor FlgM [Planctomycetaceae bacterium]